MSRQKLASMSGVDSKSMSEDTKKMVRTAFEYRQMVLKVKRSLKKVVEQNRNMAALSKRKFIDLVDELTVSSRLRKLLKAELVNFKRKPCGRVWSIDDKLFALALYKRSPRAYRFLKEHILLPSESTLKAVLQSMFLAPGICTPLLALLQKSVSKLKPKDKSCVVLFDEIFLTGRLHLNNVKRFIDGFENYGNRGRTHLVADHALVFMVQGVNRKWTQPIAYYFVHKTCPSDLLKILICDVIKAVCSTGLNVLATVSDQGPTNRGAISLLKSASLQDDIIYSVDGHKLVHIWDVPHLFKSSRNNLLSSDLEYGPGLVAKWRHIIEFLKLDADIGPNSKLTLKHVNPKGKHKMRVKYAAETISGSVHNLIEGYIRLSHGEYLPGCMVTANLLQDIDFFFDLTNGPSASDKRQKDTRVNVTKTSLHHDQWPIMVKKLQKWTFIRKTSGERHVPPFVKGWIQTVKGLQWIWAQMNNNNKSFTLKLRNYNQDALENLFCCIRQCCGNSSDVTCAQFTAALKTCLVTRFSGVVKDKNCMDDDSYLLGDLRSLLANAGDVANNCEETESLVRGARPLHGEVNVSSSLSSSFLSTSFLSTLKTDCQECKESVLKLKQLPTHWLKTFVTKCQGNFNRSWRNLLHKADVVQQVTSLCVPNDVASSWMFCGAHSLPMVKQAEQNIALLLIERKVQKINKQLKENVVKRTRQILSGSVKDADGLLDEEASIELPITELLLLDKGPDRVPPSSGASEFPFICVMARIAPIICTVLSFIHRGLSRRCLFVGPLFVVWTPCTFGFVLKPSTCWTFYVFMQLLVTSLSIGQKAS